MFGMKVTIKNNMKKLYRTKGRLFSRELGLLERMKYLWEIYVNQNHHEPKTIILTKEECETMFNRSSGSWKTFWNTRNTPINKRFFEYRGVKIITR